MFNRVTQSLLLEKIVKACDSALDFKNLREFIFDYYYGEDDYIFETEALEPIFAVLSSYLEDEEAHGDARRQMRLHRLKEVFQLGRWSVEDAIYALEHEALAALLDKYQMGILSEHALELQVRKLSPISFDFKGVISLYQDESKTKSEKSFDTCRTAY